jgi:hypothetical protein
VFLRRISRNLTPQNWGAVFVDLVVVVVGVVLAIQVERWYESRRLAASEEAHFIVLANDFASTRKDIKRIQQIHKRASDAAVILLNLDDADSETVGHDEFYQLMGDIQWTLTANVTRKTYDSLVATGGIDTIRDENLKAKIANFFAIYDGRARDLNEDLNQHNSVTF